MEFDLAQLRRPDAYPRRPASVDIVQTHISIVCLAGDRVYKLKKAVALPFLDFSTAALREQDCHEEVRLNRRLCPDVYLGVVPLRRDGERLRFCGSGTTIDHAVEMRRLPAERMMDRMLEEGLVREVHVEAIARAMAAFHARSEHSPAVLDAGRPERLADFAQQNFAETSALAGSMFDAALHAALARRTQHDFAALLPRLRERCAAGRVVEGHGDLHARNICLCEQPVIYDCIEFSPWLRCGDVAVENAFLVMDLRYRGQPELARGYVESYEAASGDRDLRELMAPLVAYRAMVRAKVAALAAADPAIAAAERDGARDSARRHFRLAAASAAEDRPQWLVGCGLPASGKSWVLERLAHETGWPYFATDRVRKELAGIDPTARGAAAIYGQSFSDETYGELFERAARATSRTPVLLDGVFGSRARREQAAAAAGAAGATICFLWFDVDEATVRERLERRREDASAVSDATLRVYLQLRDAFEPPIERRHAKLDGTAPMNDLLARILLESIT